MDADTMSTNSGPHCRICLSASENEHLMNACNCAGTVGYVHSYCLEKWISVSCSTRCELCSSKYCARRKLKYGIISSVPRFVWAQKSKCSFFYCYIKVWLYLYILVTLLKQYRMDADHMPSSISFLIFLIVSFVASIVLLVYSFVRCFKLWNRWRRCQLKFIIKNSSENSVEQQV